MNTKKILVIEDNPANMKLVNDILVSEGFTVLQATEGQIGLDIIKEKSEEISLVLVDLKLPDISGLEVIKATKADPKTSTIPMIVVSAHAMESDIKNSKEAGCIDHITKPINIVGFLNTIKSHL